VRQTTREGCVTAIADPLKRMERSFTKARRQPRLRRCLRGGVRRNALVG
jgi:hypothetical protein